MKPGIVTILTIILVVLKLFGLITWPWVWVLSPTWITFALLGLAFFISAISDK